MNRLKDNYKSGDPVASIRADDFAQLVRWVQNMECINGRVDKSWGKLTIVPFGNFSSGVQEPWVLNYSLSGDQVSLSAGHVFWGTNTMAVAAAGPFTVTDGTCYGLEVAYSGGAWGAAWVEKSAITGFVDTDAIMRLFYYKFALSGGVASISLIGKRGNWKIPSVFAPE